MAQKKIPSRQCIGCMTSRPKKELVRVVRAPSGEISIDLVGKKPGRGAYLCPNPDCLTKAKKKKAHDIAMTAEKYKYNEDWREYLETVFLLGKYFLRTADRKEEE